MKSVSLPSSRWAAYATAGAATALVGIGSAEADIHYSGIVNRAFDASPGSLIGDSFKLTTNVALDFGQGRTDSYGSDNGAAFFDIFAATAGFRGVSFPGRRYPSNLGLGQDISSGAFVPGGGVPAGFLAIHEGNPNSQWLERGTGYIGFRFNVGNGIQYGWARLRMGGAPRNRFRLIDYAWGDVGDQVKAGQKRSDSETQNRPAPDIGSLGLLALGGAGLLAWRKKRGQAAPLS